jgi:hypothetical protein
MLATYGSAYNSVGAVIRPGARRVIRVVRAIETVVVVAADEMTPSSTKVIVVHVGQAIGAEAADVASAKTSNVIAAESPHVTSTKAAHVATATAGLGTRGNEAAGKQGTCQNHHRSSSHNILQLVGRTFRHRALPGAGAFQQGKRQRREELEMGIAIRALH